MSRAERGGLALVLALTGAAAAGHYATGLPRTVAFVLAALALAGQAWTVSFATEQIGMRYGPGVTGLLQSTVGNLPEFFVVIFALQAHDTTVAETALIGSVLVNALLVLGLVLVVGAAAAPDGLMRFNTRLPNDTATLLLVSSITIVLIAVVTTGHEPAGRHIGTISVVGAGAMLIVYGVWIWRYLRDDAASSTAADDGTAASTSFVETGPADPTAEADPRAQAYVAAEAERPRVSMPGAVTMLVAAGVGSALVSDWFVDALEPAIHTFHLSQAFAGIVIVAIAGNAVENVAGIYLAHKGKSDLAISVVKNSVAQIAAFLYPLLVLVSLLTASHLTFSMQSVWAGALVGTAILIWQITGDGEATPFEGTALIALYVILATVAGFEH